MNNKRAKLNPNIPFPVIRRFAQYRTYVSDVKAQGREWVLSNDFANNLGLTSSTVRKDMGYLSFRGLTNRGYSTLNLGKALSSALGLRKTCNVVLVGAGKLGRALAMHGDFARMGFQICGIFDTDRLKLDTKVARITVNTMPALPRIVKKHSVSIGIIAVPASAAQIVANQLVKAGVAGLLNLACVKLTVPEGVFVVDARITASLAELCCCMRGATFRGSIAKA